MHVNVNMLLALNLYRLLELFLPFAFAFASLACVTFGGAARWRRGGAGWPKQINYKKRPKESMKAQ